MCTCNEKNDAILQNNILLPNGYIELCCMDYSLDYIIGDLNRSTYEEISDGDKIWLIRNELIYGKENHNVICRKCSLAKELFG